MEIKNSYILFYLEKTLGLIKHWVWRMLLFYEKYKLKVSSCCEMGKWWKTNDLWNSEILLFTFNQSILNDLFQQGKLYSAIIHQCANHSSLLSSVLSSPSPLSIYIFQQDQIITIRLAFQ